MTSSTPKHSVLQHASGAGLTHQVWAVSYTHLDVYKRQLQHDAGPDADGVDALLLDLARLSLPLLDGQQPFCAAGEAAAERVHRWLLSLIHI